MKNTERKSFRQLVGVDLIACVTHRTERSGNESLVDITLRCSSAGHAKNRYRTLDTKAQKSKVYA